MNGGAIAFLRGATLLWQPGIFDNSFSVNDNQYAVSLSRGCYCGDIGPRTDPISDAIVFNMHKDAQIEREMQRG